MIVNKESKKLFSRDIMKSTIYNIISEAIYENQVCRKKQEFNFK